MNPVDRESLLDRELLKKIGRVRISAEGKQRLRALARFAMLRSRDDPQSGVDLHDMTEFMTRAAEIGAECGGPACCCPAPVGEGRGEGNLLRLVERETILRVFESSGRDVIEAARELGLAGSTLYRKLEEYGVETKAPRRFGGAGSVGTAADVGAECARP